MRHLLTGGLVHRLIDAGKATMYMYDAVCGHEVWRSRENERYYEQDYPATYAYLSEARVVSTEPCELVYDQVTCLQCLARGPR